MASEKLTQEKIIDLLLEGKIKLYSMKDILDILNISKSTLDRWIRNGKEASEINLHLKEVAREKKLDFKFQNYYMGQNRMSALNSIINSNDDDTSITFPEADLYIGRSPRWTKQTISKWLINFNRQK